MKKAASSARRSTAKGSVAPTPVPTPTPKTVEEYLAGIPEPARSTLQRVRSAIRSAMPAEAAEAISYGIPAIKYKGTLVWFAAFSNHCSLFPGASVINAFKNELKAYKTSKGTIHFPVDKPLPAALVKKMVKARLAEKAQKEQR
jgi:uncharacterized protein YdhG (YjbR/CyaY superfamily)